MKIIIALLLSLFTNLALAEIPTSFNVYATGVGISIPYCRAMIDEYNKIYNAKASLVVKPGATGLIAMLEMVKDKNFSIQCFPGTSEILINRSMYPGHEHEHDLITMVTIVAESPVLFSARATNTYNTLPELIANKKALMVGHHTSFGLLMGTKIFDESTTFVNFKTAVDAIPSLLDGSLDVYIDSGGLTPYIESGILKSLGNLHNAINTPGVNLNKKYPGAALYKTMAAITTSKNNNLKDIEELNKRLRLILTDEKFVNMIKQVSNTPVFRSVKESNELVEFMKKDIASKK